MTTETRNMSAKLRPLWWRILLATALAIFSGVSSAEILWSGDFEDGTFGNYADSPDDVVIWGTPPYGRPLQYGGQRSVHVGNGELMWLTADSDTGNFRAGPHLGKHAVGLHVKSWAGGSVEAVSTDNTVIGDCDGSCDKPRRRTELRGMTLHYDNNYLPYMTTRWASVSIFLPADWDTKNGSDWGPTTWQWKPSRNTGSMSPPIEFVVSGNQWEINLRYNSIENPAGDGWSRLNFHPGYTSSTTDRHYPDKEVAWAALRDLNLGGWTHFVMQLRMDGRRSTEGGTGFIRVWKRSGNGPWIQVLDFFPTAEYGVLFPQSSANWGFHMSLYSHRDQVLPLPGKGRTLYYDNIKIGNERTAFAEMSHDGSSPDMSPPEAPAVEVN